MTLDITPYLQDNGLIDLQALLRDHGVYSADEVLSIRLDTVAIARYLKMSQKTLRHYVSLGLVDLEADRRMPLNKVLQLDYGTLKREAKLLKQVHHNCQKRQCVQIKYGNGIKTI